MLNNKNKNLKYSYEGCTTFGYKKIIYDIKRLNHIIKSKLNKKKRYKIINY